MEAIEKLHISRVCTAVCVVLDEGEGGNVKMGLRANQCKRYIPHCGYVWWRPIYGEGSGSAEGAIPESSTSHRFSAARDFIDSTSPPP